MIRNNNIDKWQQILVPHHLPYGNTHSNSSFTKNFYIVLKFLKIRLYFYFQIKNNDAKECKNILNGITSINVFCDGK